METLDQKASTLSGTPVNGVFLDNAVYPILPEVRNWITSHTPFKEGDLEKLPTYKPTKEELDLIFANKQDPRIVVLVRRMSPEQLQYFQEFKAVLNHAEGYRTHIGKWEDDAKLFLGQKREHEIQHREFSNYLLKNLRVVQEAHSYFVLANMDKVAKRDKKRTTQIITTPEVRKRLNTLNRQQSYDPRRAA